jgi:uncharacterized repeat protein (TIGR02543 family)
VSCESDYAPTKYILTTSVNPVDSGAVNPNGGTVDEGQQISVTATPAAEYIFDKWTGAASGTSTTVSVIMDSDKSVTANFVKKKYPLTITVEGEGTVAEKVIKAGAATDYNSGTIVELTASPSSGWKFKEWTGDLTGIDNPKQITIDKAKTVTAVFESLPFYLDENGVTIKARDWVTVGTTGELDGVTYTAVNRELLINILKEKEDVTKIVTTLITDLSGFVDDYESEKYTFGIIAENWGTSFNENISTWDVSNVTDMGFFFSGASSFNQDIGKWDLSKVSNTSAMFRKASSFNKDISKWDVSSVTNMTMMFMMSSTFNQNIGSWDVSNVTNMTSMFNTTPFNQDISKWDVSNVTNMLGMFGSASSFNQDISSWDVSNVTSMQQMFWGANVFNRPIGNWDVSKVTDMMHMFNNTIFNQDITNWDVSNVIVMRYMFKDNEVFNQDIGNWDVSSVKYMSGLFQNSSFNQDISNWDVSNVEQMNSMFEGNKIFNQDIGSWNVGNVIWMRFMFKNSIFNQNITNWNFKSENYGSMEGMFQNNEFFNQNIGSWNVTRITNMNYMFSGAKVFNQDLSKWCVISLSNAEIPKDFSTSSALTEANKPIWNTCPN